MSDKEKKKTRQEEIDETEAKIVSWPEAKRILSGQQSLPSTQPDPNPKDKEKK